MGTHTAPDITLAIIPSTAIWFSLAEEKPYPQIRLPLVRKIGAHAASLVAAINKSKRRKVC
jgi:hypothetical protein